MSTLPSNSENGPIDGAGEQINTPMSSITNEVIAGPNSDPLKKKGKWLGWRAFKAQKAAQAKMGTPQQNAKITSQTTQQIEAAKEQRERRLQETKEKKMEEQEARLELQRAERARKIEERKADGAYLVYSADELRPYRRYTHLYDERLFQKPVKSPQNISFLALPVMFLC